MLSSSLSKVIKVRVGKSDELIHDTDYSKFKDREQYYQPDEYKDVVEPYLRNVNVLGTVYLDWHHYLDSLPEYSEGYKASHVWRMTYLKDEYRAFRREIRRRENLEKEAEWEKFEFNLSINYPKAQPTTKK